MLRQRLQSARATRPAAELDRAATDLARHAVALWADRRCAAAYASVGAEPPTRALLDGLTAAGVRVLLPRIAGTDLDWASYDGWDALVVGARGLLEPTGTANPSGLREADVLVVPALAVDRSGNRLGRGAGYYDRVLAGSVPPTVAVVFGDEVLAEVPVQPHDRRVGAALTPGGLLTFDL